ncbi:MAG TPA: GspMb/PilO family protein [Dongiaceae bacterium]|nr:GspMb/PilO family protein [Dongiaceae bacterium]
MNKLTNEKRNQLIMVVGLTLLGLGALWTVLIAPLRHHLYEIAGRRASVTHKLDEVRLAIKNADRVTAELAEARAVLANVESGMASGDLYAWAINTIKEFKLSYRVEIPQFSQVDGPRDVPLLPQFPYKQASMTIGGSAFFNDLGQFLADLENQSPYIRILNLSLEPVASKDKEPVEQDKLAFKMEVVFLVKPSDA